MFYFFSSIFWKAWIRLSFKKNCSTFFMKITYLMVQCIFFSVFLANSDQEVIQFDTYCPFKDLIYCLYQGSNTNFHLQLILFGAQKFIKIVYIRENTVWPILSFQGSYRNTHWSSCIIWCSNICQKTAYGTLRFDPYCPFKDLIQISIKSSFFLVFKNLFKKLYQGPFQGSYIYVHLVLIYFLELKIYWKIESETVGFDRFFLFKDFIKFSLNA